MRKLRLRSAACAVPRWYGDVAVDERVLDLLRARRFVAAAPSADTLRAVGTGTVPITCSARSRSSSSSVHPSSSRSTASVCCPSVGAGPVQNVRGPAEMRIGHVGYSCAPT